MKFKSFDDKQKYLIKKTVNISTKVALQQRNLEQLYEKLNKLYFILEGKKLSMKEIAKEMNVSVRTANNYILKLKKHLEEGYFLEEEYIDGVPKYFIKKV